MSSRPGERFRPFKLTCKIRPPVVLAHPWVCLDGILTHVMSRRNRGEAFYTQNPHIANREKHYYNGMCMPLKQFFDVYHSSIAFFNIPYDTLSYTKFYKRFYEQDSHLVGTSQKSIQIGRGPFCAQQIEIPSLPATECYFYGFGDIEKVADLMHHVPGIGKKVAVGCGSIFKFSIEEIERDFSFIKDGVAMRPIPCKYHFDSAENMMIAYKPPYWDCASGGNVGLCVKPGAKLTDIRHSWLRNNNVSVN
ncbi:MAG: hypothetical protein FWD52_07995 [Candidatus Bathyarchaeota archaeon]|nr:hypothetical protein [Candidatus Termiticorpusculum sp.]